MIVIEERPYVLQYVYAIYCKEVMAYYIGQSRMPRQRLQAHLCALRRGEHVNPRLQTAFTRHGIDGFQWAVIGVYSSRYTARFVEHNVIVHLKAKGVAFNVAPTLSWVHRQALKMADMAIQELATVSFRPFSDFISPMRPSVAAHTSHGLTLPIRLWRAA